MAKIAIIEDDQAICQMYRIKFESEGYTVETADNGKTGLALAESMKPDIMLIDLMMPEMRGDALLAELRKSPWGKNIKVIVLTNVGKEEIPQDLMNLGVSAIILKADTTPKQVAELVRVHLGK